MAQSPRWKAINYSPARHAFYRMIYDWNVFDGPGPVSQVVSSDLDQLQANGFNVIHLYVWDKVSLAGACRALNSSCAFDPTNPVSAETFPGGLRSYPNSPDPSPDNTNSLNQLDNLKAFVHAAGQRGMKTFLNFAAGSPTQLLSGATVASAGALATNWVDSWVDPILAKLQPESAYIAGWGLIYSLTPVEPPATGADPSVTNAFLKNAANIGTFLDPCFWDAAPPEVSVSVGVSVVKDVIVQSGALVVVRVRDSKNLIDLTGKGGPFPLTAWVDDPKSRRSVTLLPRTRAGELIEFSGVVPRGGPTAVRVATTSGRLRLSGAPLGNTTSLEVTLTIPASPARVANRSLGIPLIGRKLGGESFVVPVDIE